MSKFDVNKLKIRGNKKTILFAIALAALLASSAFAIYAVN